MMPTGGRFTFRRVFLVTQSVAPFDLQFAQVGNEPNPILASPAFAFGANFSGVDSPGFQLASA